MNEFPRTLWWYAAVMFAAAAAVAVGAMVNGDVPSLWPLVLFGAFAVYSTERKVRLPNGTYVSPGFMVSMAAIVVFRDQGSIAGPLLLGLAAGLSFALLTRRTWGWIPFNAGLTALGVGAAALVYGAFPNAAKGAMPLSLLAALCAAVVYGATGWGLVVLSYAIEERHVPREAMSSAGTVLLQVLPFALVGFLLGRLYIGLGPAVLLLIIVPILIAREMFASYVRIKESHEETVHMLIKALEQKDHYTAGHAERVAGYARYIGDDLEFMPARLERLRFAALMHDIGKLVVPNYILNKPGRLTREEFERVRLHEKVGVQMLNHIDFLRPIAPTTHGDNMHFDPDDPDHPIEPYIVMIADAYDAMTSTRAYRKALPQEVAFQELRDKAGIQFHPQCVEALIGVLERRGEKHGAGFELQAEFDDAPDLGLGSAGLGDFAVVDDEFAAEAG